MATNIEMNILQSTGTYETLYPKTSTSNLEGTLSSSQLPSSIPASKISGTLSTSNIPNLSASKITSGILPVNLGGTNVSSLKDLSDNLLEVMDVIGAGGKNKVTVSTSRTLLTNMGTVTQGFPYFAFGFHIYSGASYGVTIGNSDFSKSMTLSNLSALIMFSNGKGTIYCNVDNSFSINGSIYAKTGSNTAQVIVWYFYLGGNFMVTV